MKHLILISSILSFITGFLCCFSLIYFIIDDDPSCVKYVSRRNYFVNNRLHNAEIGLDQRDNVNYAFSKKQNIKDLKKRIEEVFDQRQKEFLCSSIIVASSNSSYDDVKNVASYRKYDGKKKRVVVYDNKYLSNIHERLNQCQNSLNNIKQSYDSCLTQLRKSIPRPGEYQEALKYVNAEKDFMRYWRGEWETQLSLVIQKFQIEKSILVTKLLKLGYAYDEENHEVRKLKKSEDGYSDEIETLTWEYNDYLQSNKYNMKSWSMKNILKYKMCYEKNIEKKASNKIYQSIFHPKELWRNDSVYLWTDSTTFFKNKYYPLYNDEQEAKPIYSSFTIQITILISYTKKYPLTCIQSIRRYYPDIHIIPVNIGTDYTDHGGNDFYTALSNVTTKYVLILDHTVRFNKYTRIDILAYALSMKYVDVVSGSEEANDILYPRCYRMVNKFGKMKYQRGYHRGFGFMYIEESRDQPNNMNDDDDNDDDNIDMNNDTNNKTETVTQENSIGISGQICYRTSSYIMTSTELLKEKWNGEYPIALSIQAFFLDIQKVYTVGQIPYVSFIHKLSETNTIYKPLQKLSRTIREKFGKNYRISIYIDMDNRFTWMPYVPDEFRLRDSVPAYSSPGMANTLQSLGYSHQYLRVLDGLFHKLNIPYTSIAGNLLSSISFGGTFPWEYDTDFMIPIKFYNVENKKTIMSELTHNFTKHITQEELLAINSSSIESVHTGYYCTLLRDLQGLIKNEKGMDRYILNFLAGQECHTCARITTKDTYSSYADIFDNYVEAFPDGNLKFYTPFKRTKYLGHLVHVPSNWRELLQRDYKFDYFTSNLANNDSLPWPICNEEFKSHPNCFKDENDIYDFISEMTDEVRYWPDVD